MIGVHFHLKNKKSRFSNFSKISSKLYILIPSNPCVPMCPSQEEVDIYTECRK